VKNRTIYYSVTGMAFADLYAARTATVRVQAKSARGIASITEYWYISRLTIAATSMHALSAVTKITRLVLIIPPAFDSLYKVVGSLLMPDASDRNVSLMFDANPLPAPCPSREPQLQLHAIVHPEAACAVPHHRLAAVVAGSGHDKFAAA
jgi:hypothetical protein